MFDNQGIPGDRGEKGESGERGLSVSIVREITIDDVDDSFCAPGGHFSL